MRQSNRDIELIKIVASDLRFLRDEWDNKVDDHSLRRSSPILRRLLVEQDLHCAWKALGFEGQATIVASTLKPILQAVPAQHILFATAGGASFGGAELRGFVRAKSKLDQAQVDRLAGGPVPNAKFSLLDFVDDASVIVAGIEVKRRQVIKYVSNKLGGAHLDRRRGTTKEGMIFDLLDKASESYTLLEKPAIYFELLSIGQALVNSADVMRFLDRATEPPEGSGSA
jgi:hypothetical protein